jgi:hypothetical protein
MSNNKFKNLLKKVTILVKIKRKIFSLFDGTEGSTKLNICRVFPLYNSYSGGSYNSRYLLTIEAINKIFPLLVSLANYVQEKKVMVKSIRQLSLDLKSKASAKLLKKILDRQGSDKANNHDYHHLYGMILQNPLSIENIFEIGLGTNNVDVVSNMGINGRPGASLRAFREYCPKAFIYGADVDKRILFEEERIKTFFVDQTNPLTFNSLFKKIPNNFDLVIDDGLHSAHANVASLEFGLKIIKIGGWFVAEDIGLACIDLWKVISALLPSNYETHIFLAKGGIVFAVKRLK